MIKIIIINIIITLFIIYITNLKCNKCEHFDLATIKAATQIGKEIFLTNGKVVIPQNIVIDGNVEITKSLKIKNKII
jgi:hypothetical protein